MSDTQLLAAILDELRTLNARLVDAGPRLEGQPTQCHDPRDQHTASSESKTAEEQALAALGFDSSMGESQILAALRRERRQKRSKRSSSAAGKSEPGSR